MFLHPAGWLLSEPIEIDRLRKFFMDIWANGLCKNKRHDCERMDNFYNTSQVQNNLGIHQGDASLTECDNAMRLFLQEMKRFRALIN